MPNFARVADMVGGLRGAIADYRNNDRQAMQDKLNMVKQFMDIHSQETRGQLETAQAQEASMRTSLLPGQLKAELSQQEIQRLEQKRLYERQAFEAEQAGKAWEEQNRILDDTEIEVYRNQAPKGYANLWKSGITRSQADAILDHIKAIEGVRTVEAKTPDVIDWQAIVDANPELQGTPPTKEGVQTKLDLLKQKATEDKNTNLADRYQSMIDWTEARTIETEAKTKEIEARTKAIGTGKNVSATQQLAQIKLDAIKELVSQDVPLEDAIKRFNGKDVITDLRTLINGARKELTDSIGLSEERKTELQTKINNYEALLEDELQKRFTPEQKIKAGITKTTLGTASGDTYTMPYSEWIAVPSDKKRLFLIEQAKKGIRIIDFPDNTGVMGTIDIDENGNVIGSKRVGATKPATKPTGTLTEEQKRALLDKFAGD
jgi:exonuclease VII small subunit